MSNVIPFRRRPERITMELVEQEMRELRVAIAELEREIEADEARSTKRALGFDKPLAISIFTTILIGIASFVLGAWVCS